MIVVNIDIKLKCQHDASMAIAVVSSHRDSHSPGGAKSYTNFERHSSLRRALHVLYESSGSRFSPSFSLE
jgi:hypothetical protein